jgi:hypothetical protein
MFNVVIVLVYPCIEYYRFVTTYGRLVTMKGCRILLPESIRPSNGSFTLHIAIRIIKDKRLFYHE